MTQDQAKLFIYNHESGQRPNAVNPIGACGLGQSLPCSKLATACPDWATNPSCQDNWFNNYAKARYGSWIGAYQFWRAHDWW